MKKYILAILILGLGFNACQNPNQKEIGEVEGLIGILQGTEKSLLAVDTSRVFSAKRQMERDITEFNSINDTLSKEEAFRMAEIFNGKKKLYRLSENYPGFLAQINFSKKQLSNLKLDLENGLVSELDYPLHFNAEKASVMELDAQIDKAINGLEIVLQKLELDRTELLKILEDRRLNATDNE